jgi:AcrR family transcriptional regulator
MSELIVEQPRGTKRERTRNRLLRATQELLLERSAGSLSIRDISHQAGVSHATFYNYFESVEGLLDNLSLLLAFTHAMFVDSVTSGIVAVDEVFSAATRQTLRFMLESQAYGHFLFDAGLRIDHFATGMRAHMAADLERGKASGAFSSDTSELTLALVTGSLLGVALGLHRGELTATHIEPATERLLVQLGVEPQRAAALVRLDVPFRRAPEPPLEWPLGMLPD